MYNSKGIGGQLTMMILMGLATNTVLAGEAMDGKAHPWKDMPAAPTYSYVATVSAGPVWGNGGSQQTFFLQPNIEKTYTVNNSTNTIADGELFLGMQRALAPNYDGQLGIAVATTGKANFSGDIWDDGLNLFDNFIYSYNVRHTHVALKGIVLTDIDATYPWLNKVQPYVSGSVGVGFNRASNYTETPLIFQAVPFPNFTSNSTTSFTYTVGAGIQRVIMNNWSAGVGYEFADWGKSQLGLAPGQTLGSGLLANHYYTNGLMFNLT